MATVRAGVYTDAELYGPIGGGEVKYSDMSAPATWALIWWVVAVLLLFVV